MADRNRYSRADVDEFIMSNIGRYPVMKSDLCKSLELSGIHGLPGLNRLSNVVAARLRALRQSGLIVARVKSETCPYGGWVLR